MKELLISLSELSLNHKVGFWEKGMVILQCLILANSVINMYHKWLEKMILFQYDIVFLTT